MLRFDWRSRVLLAAMVCLAGAESLTAGGWDFWKAPAKKPKAKEAQRVVARGQEPGTAPPAVAPDPGYSPPADTPPPQQPPADPAPPQVWTAPPCTDCAPHYSGFSSGQSEPVCMGHSCAARRSASRCGMNLAKSSARMHGDSYYEDCYPLFGPRYGYYETCWRRLPEDCRCPIFIPPRKSPLTPATEEEPKPAGEVIPPPPQVLNFR